MKTSAIILGAGKGTRMKSSMPKVMHKIAGRMMIDHVIHTCKMADISDITVVIAPEMDDLKTAIAPIKTVIQKDQLGTGDAVKVARDIFKNSTGYVYILYGDAPFISPESLLKLSQSAAQTGLAILGFEAKNPKGYGRLIVKDNYIREIVEEKDCNFTQKQITLCNAGTYCVDVTKLFGWLDKLSNHNAQGEYYLTDIVSIAAQAGVQCGFTVAKESEVMGINSREQLAKAERTLQKRLRTNAMDQGVTLIDPRTTYLSMDTEFGQDIIIEPNVFIGENVKIGSNTKIYAFSHIEGATIGTHSEIGPFARIRPTSSIGNHVSIGNFIEVNRSHFADGSKSKHVSYIGDATIGEKSNIGAGTVIANYDGFNKHNTTIEKNSFIGSNSTIVAPVTIGHGAIVGAGSTITQNINPDALVVAREKEIIREGWAEHYRMKHARDIKGKK
jgi:bifunctional UDP-N-acetylglucosamine pyrophosphorylase/glucosamine-1-phosphate N-acetyltransferase